MRSLFVKIFLSFWLAMALTSIAYSILSLKTQIGQGGQLRRNLQADRRKTAGEMLELFGLVAPALYEREGSGPLRRYAGRGDPNLAHAYLFDAAGRPLFSGAVPVALQAAAFKAAQKGGLQSGPGEADIVLAKQVAGSAGRRYIAAVGMSSLPPWAFPRWPPMVRSFGIRMAVALLVGGVTCYLIVWRLTAPIRSLRAAAQRLAGGDLSARVGSAFSNRGDELADLGREFDLMAERVETLMQSQKQLARDVSHELRSPLARFNVALGLARSHCTGDADRYFDQIERDSARLNELIGELLTLSLLESGAEQLVLEAVELDALIAKVAKDANFEAESHRKKVVVAACEPATVEGNGELISRALENVVRNAVRYTREAMPVEISLLRGQDAGGQYAAITVRDHGPGVPEQALSKLFLPFYRVAEARDRKSGGTGIGLAITERAVKLHCGKVTARNAADGGLSIEIRLPAK